MSITLYIFVDLNSFRKFQSGSSIWGRKEAFLPISLLLSHCPFHLIPRFLHISPKLRTPLFPVPHNLPTPLAAFLAHLFHPHSTWLALSQRLQRKTQLPIPAEQSPRLSTPYGRRCACTAGRMHHPHHLRSRHCCAHCTEEHTEVQRDW